MRQNAKEQAKKFLWKRAFKKFPLLQAFKIGHTTLNFLKAICPQTLVSPFMNALSFTSLNGSDTNFEQVLKYLKASFLVILFDYTTQKMKFSNKDFFGKCD